MKLLNRLPVMLAAALVVAGCSEGPVTLEPTGPSFEISDGANLGNDHFFFLPPMVANPTTSGVFDGSLSPELEICVWDGSMCGATLAIFNANAGPGSETIRVNTVDEHYVVNWHTGDILDNFTLGTGETFRLRVIAEGQELGFADIEVVGSAKDLKHVETGTFIPLLDGRTLPIKFRIEDGALAEGGVVGEIVSGGQRHSCAVASDGRAYCWGLNGDGQLGIGFSGGNFNTPQLITGTQTWQSVQASQFHTCGLTTGGQMFCWGLNSTGQLGIGTTDFAPHPTPLLVTGNHTFQSLASLGANASFVSCGVTTTGAMFCWGLNNVGQLGTGTVTFAEPTPVLVTGGHTWAGSVGMDVRTTCGVTTAGDLFCWGRNDFGQLGGGTISTSSNIPNPTPALVVGGHTFQSVTVGSLRACGLTPAGVALCWGRNTEGALGLGTLSGTFPTPQFVTGGHTFTQLSGGRLTCGVRTDGAGLCWGRNAEGQLGRGTFTGPSPTPGLVVGGHTFQAIGVGFFHACGVTTSADTFCWGRNAFGQVGNGTFNPSGIATPQFAINLITP